MKILIVASMYPPHIKGGGEISTKLLAEELVKKGIDVDVLTIDYNEKKDIINGVKIQRVLPPNIYWSYNSPSTPKKVKLFWHLNEAFNYFQSNNLRDLIGRMNYDVIHTSVVEDFSTNMWRYFNQAKIPVVHTLRSYYLMCYLASMFKKGKKCQNRCLSCKAMTQLKTYNSNFVDYVVGISEDILTRHLNAGYFRNAKSSVIPNSYVRPQSYKPKEEEDNEDKTLTIGFIGKFDYHKGVDYLLEEATKIYKVTGAKLIIAGFGQLETLVKQYDKEYPFIEFIGRVKPLDFYSRIDVLIVPSLWYEPFGRIVIESYSFGKPVIASNNGGLPELVNHGKTGYIFNPQEPGQLLNYCKVLSSNKKKLNKMKEQVIHEADKFKNKKIAKKYIDVYKLLAK